MAWEMLRKPKCFYPIAILDRLETASSHLWLAIEESCRHLSSYRIGNTRFNQGILPTTRYVAYLAPESARPVWQMIKLEEV